jgi:tetratricopeptide (TPR) repeat protein
MQRLDAQSHEQIRAKLKIDEQDYWETLILFFLLGGVVFSGPDTTDAVKKRREMIIRWRDCLESGHLDPHDLLGIPTDATSTEIENAFRKRAHDFHPRQLELEPGNELYVVAMKVVEHMQTARDTLISSPESPPPITEKQVDAVNPVKQAQVCFQEALEHKARKSYVEAADCLDRAIRLDPERAKYFFQLGLCQMHLPAFRKNAEQNLLKAAEMEPWNAEPAYHLGMMFRSAGLRRMSEKYFRKALEINMDHTKAGQALQELSGSPSRRSRKGKGSFF